jgi:hypothetical protein
VRPRMYLKRDTFSQRLNKINATLESFVHECAECLIIRDASLAIVLFADHHI